MNDPRDVIDWDLSFSRMEGEIQEEQMKAAQSKAQRNRR